MAIVIGHDTQQTVSTLVAIASSLVAMASTLYEAGASRALAMQSNAQSPYDFWVPVGGDSADFVEHVEELKCL